MASYGFSYVPVTGYTAFLATLDEPPWKAVEVASFDAPERRFPGFRNVPRLAEWKLRLRWACQDATQANQLPSVDPRIVDRETWDPAQRRLKDDIRLWFNRDDLDRRAAAHRLDSALLIGRGGLGQTQLDYRKECDVGYSQVRRAGEAPLSADVALLGLGPRLAEVEVATHALADAIG
jgi:hypothetical protein